MNKLSTSPWVRGAVAAGLAAASVSCGALEAQAGGIIVPVRTSASAALCAGPGTPFCVFGGFVAFIVGYDILRRNTCSGDFLHFGGPGFNEPLNGQNTRPPPVCPH